MSTPAFGRPDNSSLRCTTSGKWTFAAIPPRHRVRPASRPPGKCRCRLRLEEAEALGQFGRDQFRAKHRSPASRDGFPCAVRRRRPHSHVAGNDCNLGLEVDAPRLVQRMNRVARPDKGIGTALGTSAGSVQNSGRHVGATRLAREFDMIDVSRTIRPLVSPWQRAVAQRRIEAFGVARSPVVECRRPSASCGQWRPIRRVLPATCGQCRARAGRVRSRLTTTSVPSRPPCFRVRVS